MVGQQAGRRFPEGRRMQRRADVGAVERLAAQMRLHVDRIPGRDERRDVRDGVTHPIADTPPVDEPAFDVHGLIEVHRARRVDCDEADVGEVAVRQSRTTGGLFGSGEHRVRKLARHAEFGADVGKALAKVGSVGDEADASVRHAATVRYDPCG